MLKDARGNKPLHIDISEDQWKEMMQNIRDGILRKLNAARNMETIDKEIAAGLYVYSVEEFGKLLLLRKASSLNGMRRVVYKEGFVLHWKKFKTAFDYFQDRGFDACLVLSQGSFVISDVVWSDFDIGLLANTEARLSIFYSDFVYDADQKPIIERTPKVDLKILQRATEQLKNATKGLRIYQTP
jgi:hypothetical protein